MHPKPSSHSGTYCRQTLPYWVMEGLRVIRPELSTIGNGNCFFLLKQLFLQSRVRRRNYGKKDSAPYLLREADLVDQFGVARVGAQGIELEICGQLV